MQKMSEAVKNYFEVLEAKFKEIYQRAIDARRMGFDPKTEPEITPAKDVAARVEGLIGPKGVAERIRSLSADMSREQVAFKIAEEIATGKIGEFDEKKAADLAIRAALAILTEGITAGPIEGIADVKIKNNSDRTRYLAIYFAGPIRAAGGTEAAQTVVVGDFVRKKLGLDRYKPTNEEIERYIEEIDIYDKIMNLQYPSTVSERREALQNIPVEITGEATENVEVSGFRDLPRVETNRVRGGAVLVLNDGILSKAPKLAKIVQSMGIEGWDWLRNIKRSSSNEKNSLSEIDVLPPNPKYIADVIAGRPVFSHPSVTGGFRLRYGRSRNTGLAASGINPATMYILDSFLAPGTHIRVERPGKGSVVMPVDTIDGPVVLLKDGSVVRVNTMEDARRYQKSVKKILFLGDLLFGYGEFLENNHPLIRSGYVPEWWAQHLKQRIEREFDGDYALASKELGYNEDRLAALVRNPLVVKPTPTEAVSLSKVLSIPLHPDYTYHWHDIGAEEVVKLMVEVGNAVTNQEKPSAISIDNRPDLKDILERLCLPHRLIDNRIIIDEHALPLLETLRLRGESESIIDAEAVKNSTNGLEAINKISTIKIMAKTPHYLGARMGRPEKAKMRAMAPPINSLFPIGLSGGSKRSLIKAIEEKTINVEVGNLQCSVCGKKLLQSRCDACGGQAVIVSTCQKCKATTRNEVCPNCKNTTKPYEIRQIDISSIYQQASKRLSTNSNLDVKCVVGMISDLKIPETLEKGILRAKYGLNVYKDGTVRFDMTNSPLTHFKPCEVKVPVSKLIELGYTHDYQGNPLTSDEQILELKVQDIVIPDKAAACLVKVAKFIDELLQKYYDLKPYYNVDEAKDLIGHLVIGLAPHTSAGILGRIIGFTTTNTGYAHPFWHAAKRRNCIAGSELVPIYDIKSNELTIKPIKEFVEPAITSGAACRVVDDYGTLTVENENTYLRVISLDPENQKAILQPIKHWIKGYQEDWVLLETASGRRITVTPGHRVLVYDRWNKKIIYKSARDTERGDCIPMLPDISLPEIPPESKINVLKELSLRLPDDERFIKFKNQVRLTGAEAWIKEKLSKYVKADFGLEITEHDKWRFKSILISNISGELPETLPKPFSHDWYNSIPLSHLEVLQRKGVFSWIEIPSNAKIKVSHDNHTINPYIDFSQNLLRIIGYYLAEGYLREDYGDSQLVITSTNPYVRRHLKKIISETLQIKPKSDKDKKQIIICGKIYSYLLAYAWRTGDNPYTKQVPAFIYSLPRRYKLAVISAFIDGCGSVQLQSKNIRMHPASEILLNQIGVLLNSLGVHHRIERPAYDSKPENSHIYGEPDLKPKETLAHTINISGQDIKILDELELYSSKWRGERGLKLEGFKANCNIGNDEQTIPNIKYTERWYFDAIVHKEELHFKAQSYCFEVEPVQSNAYLSLYHNFYTNGLVFGQCDSDEDSVLLGLDALINFSRLFLPAKRGGMMDAPLVLTTMLNPFEVDDEVWNLDVGDGYPLEFYEATQALTDPKKIINRIPVVEQRLGREDIFEGFKFTHGTSNINAGPSETSYKRLGAMLEKVEAQLSIAEKISAVDVADVAQRVLVSHFIPDIIGNLGAFTKQQFRCQKCNKRYRRVPLGGLCYSKGCGGKILPTVYKGGIEKYMEVAEKIIEKYNLPPYLSERLEIVKMNIKSLFESDKVKQSQLSQFF